MGRHPQAIDGSLMVPAGEKLRRALASKEDLNLLRFGFICELQQQGASALSILVRIEIFSVEQYLLRRSSGKNAHHSVRLIDPFRFKTEGVARCAHVRDLRRGCQHTRCR